MFAFKVDCDAQFAVNGVEIEDGVAEDGWTDITNDELDKRIHSDRVSEYAAELQKRYN